MITETRAESGRVGLEETTLTTAIAVLVERIGALQKEDRDDLFELSKVLFTENSREELESAARAMQEILEQAPIEVKKLDMSPSASPGLARWIEYVSARIRSLRKGAGLTQTQLSERSGIPQGHISNLERGKHSPSFATLKKLAGAIGVPISDLDPSA